MAHIGILVTMAPCQFENWETAVDIADVALEKGHKVSFFFYDDGVLNPLRRQSSPPAPYSGALSAPYPGALRASAGIPCERFASLLSRGVAVLICGTGAKMRGLEARDFIDGVKIGGLPDFALLLTEIDRLVCL